jgi:thioredoxin-like negative regulator of GroEL
MAIILTNNLKNYNNIISNNEKVIVVFSAGFCKPCKEIYPYIEELAEQNTDIIFIKVDIEDGCDISEQSNIQSIPHFKFFKSSKELISFSGANKQSLQDSIKKLKE